MTLHLTEYPLQLHKGIRKIALFVVDTIDIGVRMYQSREEIHAAHQWNTPLTVVSNSIYMSNYTFE
jgi:hypothetical protein